MYLSRKSNKDGFTFAECLLALVILGVALAPLLLCFPIGAKQGRLSKQMTVATDLALDLMDEIKKMAFEEPDDSVLFGPEGGEVISGPRNWNLPNDANDYDDVDDYNGWSKTPPQDMDGNAFDGTGGRPDYGTFTRSVEVIYVTEADLNTEAPIGDQPTDFKRIKVTVSEPDISEVEIVTVVTKY